MEKATKRSEEEQREKEGERARSEKKIIKRRSILLSMRRRKQTFNVRRATEQPGTVDTDICKRRSENFGAHQNECDGMMESLY